MTSRKKVVVISSAFVVSLLMVSFFINHRSATQEFPVILNPKESSNSFKKTSGLSQKPGIDVKKPADPAFKFAPLSVLDQYFKIKGVNPTSLACAYYITGNFSLIERMKEFDSDPAACAFLAINCNTNPDREKYASMFYRLQPENAYSALLYSKCLFKNGNPTKAAEIFEEAASKSSFQNESKQYEAEIREAYKFIGYSALDVRMVTRPSRGRYPAGLADVMTAGLQYAKIDKGGVDAELAATTNLLRIAKIIQSNDAGNSNLSRTHAFSLESRALGKLPPDTEYGESGMTVRDYLLKTGEEIKAEQEENSAADEALLAATEIDRQNYFDRLDLLGVREANKWILKGGK